MEPLSEFINVCSIEPARDSEGCIKLFYPEQEYPNKDSSELNCYGEGPFCKFSVPVKWNGAEGVYAFVSGSLVLYIGETIDLGQRFNIGYGHISPRNCYVGGQSTNCRINKLVLERILVGEPLSLLFKSSTNRKDLETNLIEKFQPEWNIAKKIHNRTHTVQLREKKGENMAGRRYKYLGLQQHLEKSEYDTLELTYEQIESIIHDTLPISAHRHREWWANTRIGHTHARSWLEAGFKVSSITMGVSVQFSRVES